MTDDEELINTLGRSKATSSAINNRLSEAETTTAEINDIREGYRAVAARGSVIYFVVASLAVVDPMYQYSLQFFKSLVVQRLERTEKKELLQDRLSLLIADLTSSIFGNVCRGLFEKDKLLCAYLISVKIGMAAGHVSDSEWLTFIVGGAPNVSVIEKQPIPEQLHKLGVSERDWNFAVMLEYDQSIPFLGLISDIKYTHTEEWAFFFTTDTPHSDTLPGTWETKLSSFQRLLLVRVLREEKVAYAMRRYVGNPDILPFYRYLEPYVLDINNTFLTFIDAILTLYYIALILIHA